MGKGRLRYPLGHGERTQHVALLADFFNSSHVHIEWLNVWPVLHGEGGRLPAGDGGSHGRGYCVFLVGIRPVVKIAKYMGTLWRDVLFTQGPRSNNYIVLMTWRALYCRVT